MESLRRFNHGNKGGGGGGGRKVEGGVGGDRRKLERRNATKNFNYEHTRPKRGVKYDSESSYDESDSNHSREDPYVFDEYRVMGKASVDEMNEVCRYLGLPGPHSLGITREDWDANRFPASHAVDGTDSVTSTIQEDPSDFTFMVSPHPSYMATSLQDPFREANGRASNTGVEQASVNYGVSTSPSTLRNEADAGDVGNLSEQHRQQGQERVLVHNSHRFSLGWRTRSASLPTTQNRSFSPPPSSLVLAGTPRPLFGKTIFDYPDPVKHIQRAQSQPLSPNSDVIPGPIEVRVVGEEKVKSDSVLGSNNVSLKKSAVPGQETVDERSADPASVVTREDPMAGLVSRREGDLSSRSSSYSDGSGEYSSISSGREASRSPEQRTFEKKQDVRPAKAVAPFIQGGSLNRPPPISLLNLPSNDFSTHDLLNGLGPSDPSVAVVGRQISDSDSEEDEQNEEVSYEGSDTDHQSREGSNGKPQDSLNQVRDRIRSIQITVISSDGKKAADAGAPIDEVKAVVGAMPSEIEGNGEGMGQSVDVQENTISSNEQIRPLDLTPSRLPAEELYMIPSDHETGTQTITFPWSKGGLLGAGSFGTVYDAVDSNGRFFAVKEVSLIDTDKNSQQCISQLEQEIELLSGFKHENIVQYLGTDRADGKLYIFLELVRMGSLASLCKKFRLTHSHIVAYTRQILKGLKYLHDMNIVHRDIKCANILVDVRGTCKLADFGLAKQISALDQLKSCKGSAYWMAPEVIDPKKTYWLPADIWSLGCSVLEMFTGSPPFGDQEWYRVLWKVGHGEAPPIPEDLSDDAKDFIQQCLEVNPSKRPTATALLQHRFLSTSSTPTNSGHMNPQLVVSSLHTISEERTGDFTTRASGTYGSSLGDSPLSNGHSGH